MDKYNVDENQLKAHDKDFVIYLEDYDTTVSTKTKLLCIKEQEVFVDSLKKELKSKIMELEAHYENLYKEHYSKRQKIISGIENSQLQNKLKLLKLENSDFKNEENGIPEFWVKALESIEFKLEQKINEKDYEILKHLKDISVEQFENGSFALNFIFESNKYILNTTTLFKKFILNEKDLSIKSIISSKIEWSSQENNPFFILEEGEENQESELEKKKRPCSK